MPRQPRGMTRVNLYMQDPVIKAGQALAKHRGTTYSDVVRAATLEYLRNEVPKMKEELEATNV